MSIKTSISILLLLLLSSCGLQQRERHLQQLQDSLNQQSQSLALKEQELNSRESILNDRQKEMDSVDSNVKDTLATLYPEMEGDWVAKMVCTQTNCPGSAIGDSKVEQWSLKFYHNKIIVKAMNNKLQLSRIYTGSIDADGQINLTAQSLNLAADETLAVKITIQLKQITPSALEGQRDIVQPGDCHIIYRLNVLKKKQGLGF